MISVDLLITGKNCEQPLVQIVATLIKLDLHKQARAETSVMNGPVLLLVVQRGYWRDHYFRGVDLCVENVGECDG